MGCEGEDKERFDRPRDRHERLAEPRDVVPERHQRQVEGGHQKSSSKRDISTREFTSPLP